MALLRDAFAFHHLGPDVLVGAPQLRLLFADETMLLTLKTTPLTQLKRFEEFLFSTGQLWPHVLGKPSFPVEHGNLRVSQDGLFDGDKKLADLADLVLQTPRAEVVEVLIVIIPKPASPFVGLDIFAGGHRFGQAATDTEPAKDLGWGWEAGATLLFGLRWLGINAAVGHQTVAGNVSGYHFVAGPRVTSPWYIGGEGFGARFFAHALGGFGQTNGTTPSQSSAE